jgi:glutathione synthase/RimK-type ligase-like ATP-grasp enzyme
MSEHPIVIVGALEDAHARAVYEGVRARGFDPVVLDAQQFPEQLGIALGHELDDIVIDGRRVGRPAAVYVRSLYQSPAGFGVDADEAMRDNWMRTLLAFRERSTLLSAILLRWERLGCALYNPPSVGVNITKPYQIALLRAAGLPVPETLWTNDPAAVRRFCEGREVIFKPVAGGAATRKLGPEDLSDARLAKLGAAPVCFQALLPGDDVRVYVIDDQVVCALRIVTEAIDFRQNEQQIEAIELAPEVAAMCVRAAAVIGLPYTGMDIKADRDGRYRILELNPSAMFLGFESRANVEICGPLCDALVKHVADPGAERVRTVA